MEAKNHTYVSREQYSTRVLLSRSEGVNMLLAAEDFYATTHLNWSSPSVAQRLALELKRTDEELTTRAAQEVHLDKQVKLLDSPGIVFPKATDAENDIILRHCVQIEKIPDPVSPVEAIVKRVQKPILLSVYKIPDYDDSHEFLRHVAKSLGKVGKGGVADLKSAARKVIQDWVGGRVPFYRRR